MDEEKRLDNLREILKDILMDELPLAIENYKEVCNYCALLRADARGVKGMHGRAEGILKNPDGWAGARRLFCIPMLLKRPIEIHYKDPYFWKNKKNIKRYFPELCTVDPRTI